MLRNKQAAIFVLAIVADLTVCTADRTLAESLKDSSRDVISAVFWQGSDFANRSESFWVGGAVAVNRDLTLSGVLLRADGEYDRYDYFQKENDLGKVRGYEWQGDAMLGYQIVNSTFAVGAYAGVDVRYDYLSPNDITNRVRGQQTGLKLDADLETERNLPYYLNFDGFYSTAFQTYWARLRLGMKVAESLGSSFGEVFIGPEGFVLGNEETDAQRVGGFLNFTLAGPLPRALEISLSAGYQFVNDSDRNSGGISGTTGGAGAYGMVEFKYLFCP
jgi:hypothetical protein